MQYKIANRTPNMATINLKGQDSVFLGAGQETVVDGMPENHTVLRRNGLSIKPHVERREPVRKAAAPVPEPKADPEPVVEETPEPEAEPDAAEESGSQPDEGGSILGRRGRRKKKKKRGENDPSEPESVEDSEE